MNKIKFTKKSFAYIIIVFLIIYILFIDSASFYKTYKIKHKLAILEQDIEELKKENEKLKLENDNLENDKNTWEKKARELGMQKKGEEIYIFKESEDL